MTACQARGWRAHDAGDQSRSTHEEDRHECRTHLSSRCLEAPLPLTPSEGRAIPNTRSILRAPFNRATARAPGVAARRALRRDLARHPEIRQGGRGLPARAPIQRRLDCAPRPQAIPSAPPRTRRAARSRLQEGHQLPARFHVSVRLVPVEPRPPSRCAQDRSRPRGHRAHVADPGDGDARARLGIRRLGPLPGRAQRGRRRHGVHRRRRRRRTSPGTGAPLAGRGWIGVGAAAGEPPRADRRRCRPR